MAPRDKSGRLTATMTIKLNALIVKSVATWDAPATR